MDTFAVMLGLLKSAEAREIWLPFCQATARAAVPISQDQSKDSPTGHSPCHPWFLLPMVQDTKQPATSEKLAQHCVADQWQASRDTAFLPGPLSVEQFDTAIQSGKSLQTSQPDSSISLS